MYKKPESRETQMNQHGQVTNASEAPSKCDWKGEVDNTKVFKKYRKSFIKMSKDFRTMQDGYSKRIKAGKHLIEHESSNKRLINLVLYHGGSRKNNFGKQ